MPVPERITLQQLTEIYQRMGFYPIEGEPLSFARPKDGMMLFHSPYRGDEFYWTQVVEDIKSAEEFCDPPEDLQSQFLEILSEFF